MRDVPPVTPGAGTPAEVFRPKRQYPRWGTFLLLRATGAPGALEQAVRQRLTALDPGLELGRFRTLDQALERQVVSPRFALALAGAFAFVALALAAVGLYGVLAFSVASRTREIGIRLALGATPRGLALATLMEGLRLVGGGLALGVVAATAADRLLRGLVPDLPPGDAGTHAAAALVVLARGARGVLSPRTSREPAGPRGRVEGRVSGPPQPMAPAFRTWDGVVRKRTRGQRG